MEYRWHEIVRGNVSGGNNAIKKKGRWERGMENCLRMSYHDAYMFKNVTTKLHLFCMITEILIMISTKKYLKIMLIRKYYIHNPPSHIVMYFYLRKFRNPANFHSDIIWLQSQWNPYYRMAETEKKKPKNNKKKKSALQIFTNTSQEVGTKASLEETERSKILCLFSESHQGEHRPAGV